MVIDDTDEPEQAMISGEIPLPALHLARNAQRELSIAEEKLEEAIAHLAAATRYHAEATHLASVTLDHITPHQKEEICFQDSKD